MRSNRTGSKSAPGSRCQNAQPCDAIERTCSSLGLPHLTVSLSK